MIFFFQNLYFQCRAKGSRRKSAAYLIKKQNKSRIQKAQATKHGETRTQRLTSEQGMPGETIKANQSWCETTKLKETKKQDLQHKIPNTNVTEPPFKERIQDSNRQRTDSSRDQESMLHIKRYNNIDCLFFLFVLFLYHFLFSFLKWTFF